MKKMTEARKELVEAIGRRRSDWGSNALFGFLHKGEEGYQASETEFGACHAGVMGIQQPLRAKVTHIVSAIRREDGRYDHTKATDEEAKTWLDFIMNRSPWAYVFTLKGASTRWSQGWVCLKTSAPGNILQGALISTRMTWEYGTCCRVFTKLKAAGVDEHTAFLMSFFMYVSSEGVFLFTSQDSDHTCLSPEKMKVEGAKAFYQHKPIYKALMYAEGQDSTDSRGVHKAFTGEGRYVRMLLRDLLKVAQREGQPVAETRATNPFARAKAPVNERNGGEKFTLTQAVRLGELFKEEVMKDG